METETYLDGFLRQRMDHEDLKAGGRLSGVAAAVGLTIVSMNTLFPDPHVRDEVARSLGYESVAQMQTLYREAIKRYHPLDPYTNPIDPDKLFGKRT